MPPSITPTHIQCVIQKQPKKNVHKQFDLIPINYKKLLPILVQNHLVARAPVKSLCPLYSKWYNPNAKCDYHGRVVGHFTKGCETCKHKVQAFIDAKWFDPTIMACKEFRENN